MGQTSLLALMVRIHVAVCDPAWPVQSSFYEFSSTIIIIQEVVKHRTKNRKGGLSSRFEMRESQGVLYVWSSGGCSPGVTAMRNRGYSELLSNMSMSTIAIVNTHYLLEKAESNSSHDFVALCVRR